jgi:hypothetical protein
LENDGIKVVKDSRVNEMEIVRKCTQANVQYSSLSESEIQNKREGYLKNVLLFLLFADG